MKLFFSSNKIGKQAQRVQHDGREYLVAPVVAIRAGVLNGQLVPGEEIGRYPESWNGIPVPLSHPRYRGKSISANTPEIEASQVVGRFWNAQWDGDRLRGEIWLDVEKATRLGGDALEALERIERGDAIEVSTAYFSDVELVSGEANGKRYSGIAHNLRPDHLAILLHEIGACSWAGGCGVPRVNAQEDRLEHLTANQRHSGVMIALYPSAADAAGLALSGEGLPEGSLITPAEEIHLTLMYLGQVADMQIAEGDLLRWVMEFAQNNPIVRGEVSGIGRFNTDSGDGMQALYASYDSLMLAPLRYWLAGSIPQFQVENHGFTPHITLAYIPMEAAMPNILPEAREMPLSRIGVAWGGRMTLFDLQGEAAMVANKKGFSLTEYARAAFGALAKAVGMQTEDAVVNDAQEGEGQKLQEESMERVELIEKLVANAGCPFDQAELEAMRDSTLAKVEKAVESGGCGGQPTANAAVEVLEAQVGTFEIPEALQQAIAEIQAFAADIRALGGVEAIKNAVVEVQANRQQHKADLVAELKANERCAFGAAELEAMDAEKLEKLAMSLRPVNYAGRGGVRGNGTGQQAATVPDAPAVLLATNGN